MTRTFPLHELHERLFAWWLQAGRVLPWRTKQRTPSQDPTIFQLRETAFSEYMTKGLRRDPYRVVVAELMLQQTQVDRVLPKYLDWMKQWPTVADLAGAQLAEVLIFWKGLGYNRRARFLWLLAKTVVEEKKGEWPRSEEELLKLPGLGKYTARAVMSFAFGEEVAVVDTNVKRVLRRILDGVEAAADPALSEKEWFALADRVLPPEQADPWNQLMMDFGATVCSAKVPKCEVCPVSEVCQAQRIALSKGFSTYREYLVSQVLPKKSRKQQVRFEDSDRYFRGRIIDLLRERQMSRAELWGALSEDHGLVDQTRFVSIVQGLLKDQMIRSDGEIFQLG